MHMYYTKIKLKHLAAEFWPLIMLDYFLGRLASYIYYLTASRPLLLFYFSEGLFLIQHQHDLRYIILLMFGERYISSGVITHVSRLITVIITPIMFIT